MNAYYIGLETPEGMFIFGEDNKFYNVEYPDADLTKDMLFTFTRAEAEEVSESLFNFEYTSLDFSIDLIPESDFSYLN